MAFVLAHISDVHLGPLPAMRTRDFLSKRVTGYINWHRNRAAALGNITLSRVTEAIADHGADHVAITGDLTNLAMDAELEAAALWLETLGDPDRVSVVPGNHDAYVRGAVDKASIVWRRWMTTDTGFDDETHAYPFVRVRGPVAIIGISSAVATPSFVAAGRFGSSQAMRVAKALDETGRAGLFRIVLIHHPPVRNAATPSKRLYGIRRFQDMVRNHGAELVLHGHTHLPQRHSVPGMDGTEVPVIGVPAAGQALGGSKPAGGYNRLTIERKNGGWNCSLQAWSVTTATGPLEITEETVLTG